MITHLETDILEYKVTWALGSITTTKASGGDGIPAELFQILKDGKTMETVRDFIFLGSKIIADGDRSHEIKRRLLLEKSYDQPRQHVKKQRHYFANKGLSTQSYDISHCHVWM